MICPNCSTYPVMLSADKSSPSVKTKMDHDGSFAFFHQMYEEPLCYYCQKKLSGKFDLPDNYFRRGNFVNSHNDGNNHHRFMATIEKENENA